MAVSDTGIGISDAARDRVFEPFFTTKAMGSGLGLSAVYGLVRQSGGEVSLESRRNEGTTFSLFFPVAPLPETIPEPPMAPVTSLLGSEVVLVVEDVDEARSLLAQYLRELGYVVFDAPSGWDALKFAKDTPRVDFLVTDVVMPLMSGPELAESVMELFPDLRIVFTSGLPSYDLTHRRRFEGRSSFIEKPFLFAALASSLRRLVPADDATP